MSSSPPSSSSLPFELPLAIGGVLRGLQWAGTRAPVLFVHDFTDTDDLDRWCGLPASVNLSGFTVLAIDLPGHGLSDGESTVSATREAIETCLTYLSETSEKKPLVAAAGAACGLLPAIPLAAAVLFSPTDVTGSETVIPKLVFVGADDPAARSAADRYLRSSRGWTIISSYATVAQGTDLLATEHALKISSQAIAFLRDYG